MSGIDTALEANRDEAREVRSHPWIAHDVPVRGFVCYVETGRLYEVRVRRVWHVHRRANAGESASVVSRSRGAQRSPSRSPPLWVPTAQV